MIRRLLLLAVMLIAIGTSALRAQIVAVNTDLLMDGCLAPNLGVEFGLNSKSSLSLNAMYGKNAFFSDIKLTAIQPEWRFYFSGRPMYHHFIGIGAVAASYDAHFNDKVYNGDGAGVGVTFGYVLPISSHLNIDFHAGCGLFFYRQKEYFEAEGFDKYMEGDQEVANAHGSQILPTRIGISLHYIIK